MGWTVNNEIISVELGEMDWKHLLTVLDYHCEKARCPDGPAEKMVWLVGRDRLSYIASEIRAEIAVTDQVQS